MSAENQALEAHTAATPKIQIEPVVAECRSLFQKEFKPMLERFFVKVDDELFSLSDRAGNNVLQELYFGAMRYLRRERDNIECSYLNALLHSYDEFWTAPPQLTPAKQATTLELDEDDFSLVEEEALEEDLAVSTLVNKGNTLYYRELYALNKRLAKLIGRTDISNESNPLAPHNLGHTFAQVLRPLTLELKVRLILFKLYEREIIGDLGALYDALNDALAKRGVLPEISKKIKKKRSASTAFAGVSDDNSASSTVSPQDSAVYVQMVQALHSLLAAWRTQAGLPSLAAMAAEPGVTVSDTKEVVGALSALQDPEQVARLTEALQNGEETNLKLVLAKHLSETHGGKRALTQVDEDVIDMIGMIFDFILEDRNLPDVVKALIGRLQIPIVKVAILDKSFFSKKNHPARVLLNHLAHASIGLSGDENLEHNPVFRQITIAVERILNEFGQDVSLFDEVLKEFSQFMEQEGRRSQVLEERTRQAAQNKEHLLLGKQRVSEEIATRLRDKELPPRLKYFLDTTWKDILLVACLRRDKEPKSWEDKLSLTDTLLWSLTPPQEERERKKILKHIPGLLRALRREFEAISLDPKETALFFKELEQAHRAILSHQYPEKNIDLRLQRELEAISANLPEVDDLKLEELIGEEDIREEIIMMAEEQVEEDDKFLEQARKLEVGEWVELTDRRGKTVRAKLFWVSQVTGMRIFVNRRGVKVAEYTLNGLAAELRRGGAKVIEGRVPLMDRALAAMMTTLKQPGKQADDDKDLDASLVL